VLPVSCTISIFLVSFHVFYINLHYDILVALRLSVYEHKRGVVSKKHVNIHIQYIWSEAHIDPPPTVIWRHWLTWRQCIEPFVKLLTSVRFKYYSPVKLLMRGKRMLRQCTIFDFTSRQDNSFQNCNSLFRLNRKCLSYSNLLLAAHQNYLDSHCSVKNTFWKGAPPPLSRALSKPYFRKLGRTYLNKFPKLKSVVVKKGAREWQREKFPKNATLSRIINFEAFLFLPNRPDNGAASALNFVRQRQQWSSCWFWDDKWPTATMKIQFIRVLQTPKTALWLASRAQVCGTIYRRRLRYRYWSNRSRRR
jgi:hypothetical protein